MPVLPNKTHPFKDPKTLHCFLSEFQQSRFSAETPAITTVVFDIDPVDPLAIIQTAIQNGLAHFYLEKPSTHEAIASFGVAHRFTADGPQRFRTMQRQLAAWNEAVRSPEALKHQCFLGSFTFFDQGDAPEHGFLPGELVLPQWQVIRRQNQYQAIAHLPQPTYGNLEPLTETLWHQFQTIIQAELRPSLPPGIAPLSQFWQTGELQSFPDAVVSALTAIQQHRVHKLVLAHALDVFSPIPFDVVQSLQNLRQLHPDCRVFSVNHGGSTTFLGASPETLISIRDGCLMTDALAGSAARGRTLVEDAALGQQLFQSPKERHEHQIVVDFLSDRLTQLGIVPQHRLTPELLKLSNIQHLHTPLYGSIPPHLHAMNVLGTLHPTPAVAGIPPQTAMELIQEYETFGRSLYAAPIGWVDATGNAEFIVGIRSALLAGSHARLFAGAGIVSGSDPHREQAEVKLKLQALLRALA